MGWKSLRQGGAETISDSLTSATTITKSCRGRVKTAERIYPPVDGAESIAPTWKVVSRPEPAFKVPFAAADVLGWLLLLGVGCSGKEKDRAFRVAVYAWNPLVIVGTFAGEAVTTTRLALLGICRWPWRFLKKRPVLAALRSH